MHIEQEDTRVELVYGEDEAKYLLRDPVEIKALFRALLASRGLVSARMVPGGQSFITALIEADEQHGILLDASTDPLQNDRIAQSEALDCVTQLDRVRIQFLVRRPVRVVEEGKPGSRAPFPTTVLRLQRREFYRLQTPSSSSPRRVVCRLPLPLGDGTIREVELNILDISRGGLAIAVPPGGVTLEQGAAFEDCTLLLPDNPPISARLIVRNLFRITRMNGVELLRIGCAFANLSRGAGDAIQRYVLRMERERNARERGLT